MKKTLSIVLSITTILWMLPLTTLVAFGQTSLVDGDLIRGPDGIKVYIIKPFAHGSYAGFKRHIFNPAVFNMYSHFDWNNIKTVDQATLDSYHTSDLYRVLGDTRVYGMNEIDEAAGLAEKRWVNMTGEEFLADGYMWEQIFTINGTEGAFYSTGADILVGGGSGPVSGGSGAVNVGLASDTPGSKVVATGSSFNDVLKVMFTAGSQAASVTGITVTKYGLLANTNVSNVSVWDSAGVRHGNVLTSLTSDNKVSISFTSNPINIPAGGSAYVVVKASFASGSYSGTAYFGVASAADVESAGSIGGSFPVVGNVMSLTDGSSSLGAYTIAAQAVGGSAYSSGTTCGTTGNSDIGETKEVAKFQFTSSNSNEDLLVDSLTVYVNGSVVETTDVKNWVLIDQGGVQIAAADRPVDRKVTFNLATPYTIGKGTAKTFTVKATIMDGATRNFSVAILENFDMMVRGASTGFNIVTSSTVSLAAMSGATPCFIIKSGAMTVTKSTTSPTGEVSPGSTNVELAKFELRGSGEQLELRKMALYVARSVGNATNLSGTIKVQSEDGNATYLSMAASTATAYAANLGASTQFDLSSYISLGSGETKILKVIADIGTTATSGTYTVGVGNFYAKRMSTNDFTTLVSSTGVDGNALTVSAASLTIAQNSSFASKNLSPGSNGVVIGSYALQASSAEDIRISSITLTWAAHGSHASPSTDLTNLSIWDGSTQFGSTVGTPNDTSNSFSGTLTVPKSATKILDIKANIASGTGSGEVFISTVGGSAISAIGVNSGNAATLLPGTTVTGQTMTMAAGTLTITKDSASSGSKIFTAGLSQVELEQLNFAAANESLTLSKITLEVGGTAGNLGMVYLKDGATTIGSTTLFSGDAVFTGLSVEIPADGTKKLGVYADVNGSGIMTAGATTSIHVKSDTPTTDIVVNKSSGGALVANDINGAGANTDFAASSIFLFHNSAPVIALAADSPSGTTTGQAGQVIAKFTVYNQGTRDMRMASIGVTLTPSSLGTNGGVATDSVELWDGTTRLAAATGGSLVTSATTFTFDDQNDISGVLTNYVISAGSTKTFTVKANTTTMRTGLTAGQTSTLVTQIGGSVGSLTSGGLDEEDNWNDGEFIYYYTPVGGSSESGAFSASDNYPVNGGTLTY